MLSPRRWPAIPAETVTRAPAPMADQSRASVAARIRSRAGSAACDWRAIVPGLALTQSVGVAGYRSGESVAQLLKRVDEALYEAKGAGRNRAVIKD